MIFLSFEFFLFFLAVLAVFHLVPRAGRRATLLGASLLFLLSWHWSFVFVHVASSFVGYFFGRKIAAARARKKDWLPFCVGVALQLLILVVFKYGNPFSVKLELMAGADFFSEFGVHLAIPLGLSYYTLQIIGYLFDVRRGTVVPTGSFPGFLLFTAFFPQLPLGPVHRYDELAPQLDRLGEIGLERRSAGSEALYFISLGIFKRLLIVNNLSPVYLRAVTHELAPTDGGLLLYLQLLFHLVYLYCDISSYIDIARGLGHALGIEIGESFRRPLFAKSPTEFWNSWQLWLVRWVRDYVYLPLLLKTKSPLFCLLVMIFAVRAFHDVHYVILGWVLFWWLWTVLYIYYRRHLKPRIPFLRDPVSFLDPLKVLVTLSLASWGALFAYTRGAEGFFGGVSRLLTGGIGASDLARIDGELLPLIAVSLVFVLWQESASPTRGPRRPWSFLLACVNIFLAVSFGAIESYPLAYIGF